MSIFDDAHVVLLQADYVGVDPTGKVNAIGAGFTVTAVQQTGTTAPMHLVALIDVPSKYAGKEFAFSLELRDDETGAPVQIPGPSGQMESMRIQQVIKGERLNVPGAYIPEAMFVRMQVAIGFMNGLPLGPGRFYHWRAEIDGRHDKSWTARFYILGPPPALVFGGPSGPTGIPSTPPTPGAS
ncbi:MAG: hypothetical protein ACR2K2_17000 [Mycobacteriales bacterium]